MRNYLDQMRSAYMGISKIKLIHSSVSQCVVLVPLQIYPFLVFVILANVAPTEKKLNMNLLYSYNYRMSTVFIHSETTILRFLEIRPNECSTSTFRSMVFY